MDGILQVAQDTKLFAITLNDRIEPMNIQRINSEVIERVLRTFHFGSNLTTEESIYVASDRFSSFLITAMKVHSISFDSGKLVALSSEELQNFEEQFFERHSVRLISADGEFTLEFTHDRAILMVADSVFEIKPVQLSDGTEVPFCSPDISDINT